MTSNNNFYTRSSKHETLVSNAKAPWFDIQIFQAKDNVMVTKLERSIK